MPEHFFQRKKKGRDNPPTLQSIQLSIAQSS